MPASLLPPPLLLLLLLLPPHGWAVSEAAAALPPPQDFPPGSRVEGIASSDRERSSSSTLKEEPWGREAEEVATGAGRGGVGRGALAATGCLEGCRDDWEGARAPSSSLMSESMSSSSPILKNNSNKGNKGGKETEMNSTRKRIFFVFNPHGPAADRGHSQGAGPQCLVHCHAAFHPGACSPGLLPALVLWQPDPCDRWRGISRCALPCPLLAHPAQPCI